MKDVLLVDGYNIIGDWPELKELREKDLAQARDLLIEKMAEYQAFKGWEVKVIFDAHMVPGVGKKYLNYRIDVVYTRENETADERIEKLVREIKNVETRVHVATSDYAEQSLIFGSGALRKSARELRIEMELVEEGISRQVQETKERRIETKLPISKEIAEIFDKWRREGR
ncbi:NYN domain-containing protein [Thalassorhabdus alkalitolerans]|uniref:NYN domain-containing protein n=1 Tax=Thalassorhabdus alkalitolerans TaxID=2282697 RepID=A0ABW0YTU0_9BACI|nr:NYN domain-containing protein [Bacillus sp. FJAT-44742]